MGTAESLALAFAAVGNVYLRINQFYFIIRTVQSGIGLRGISDQIYHQTLYIQNKIRNTQLNPTQELQNT
jgi:hypothetical protein